MSRLDIGRRVDEHVRPDTPALQGFAFARCCGFSSASIPHALTGKVGSGSRRFRPHAVAYDLWLPPAGSIRDLHPPPFIHARRTQSPYGLLPIPSRSLSQATYSCVDPPPPSTLISRGEVSHRCWHRGGAPVLSSFVFLYTTPLEWSHTTAREPPLSWEPSKNIYRPGPLTLMEPSQISASKERPLELSAGRAAFVARSLSLIVSVYSPLSTKRGT